MISWVGGKSIHTKWIVPQLPEIQTYDTYVEPFTGAGWIYFKGLGTKLQNHKIILNDADSFLANDWFCCVNKRLDLLGECSKLPPHNHEVYNRIKEEIIKIDPDTIELGDMDMAVKHLYLISQRFVSASYSLPKPSSGKWERFLLDLNRKADIFDNIDEVHNMDFQEVIEKYDSPRTLFYTDPPYYDTENYYMHEFLKEDHLRLADCLKNIRGKFALSYYDFPELGEWFPESEYPWYRHAAKNVMGVRKGKKIDTELGGKDIEILVKNYDANEALSDAKKKLIEF